MRSTLKCRRAMATFQIDSDLLNLLSWVVWQTASGLGSSVITARTVKFHADGTTSTEGNFRWLEEVFEAHQELKANQSELEDHIVWSAAEFLLWPEREAMMSYAAGLSSLTPDFKGLMNKRGFMLGDKFPQAVQRWIDIRAKAFYGLDEGDEQP